MVTDSTEAGRDGSHRTVSRVVRILQFVATAPNGARLNELAESLDAPKSSIHGLVKGLEQEGFLTLRNGQYRIGAAVDRIAPRSQRSLIELAEPAMAALHASYNETVVLSTLVGGTLMYIATRESTHPIRYVPPRRRPQLPRPSASLKILLADFQEREARMYLSRTLAHDEVESLIAEMVAVRESGIAFNRGETYEGMSAAAAAIRTPDGIVACLSVGGVTERMSSGLEHIGESVLHEAREISRAYSAMTRNV